MDFFISESSIKSAITVSLLSVWVLVGLFQYLNRYTQRRYFNIWTAAWLFYALFLTLSVSAQNFAPSPLLLMCKNWCIATSATLLFWGSFKLLKLKTSERLMGVLLAFITVWSYTAAYAFPGEIWIEIPAFAFLGLASAFNAYCFFSNRQNQPYLGGGLLSFGFFAWAIYLFSYPFIQKPEYLLSLGFLVAGVLQLFIAISMIILVLEEVRANMQSVEQRFVRQKNRADLLRKDAARNQERYRTLFQNASDAIVIADENSLEILESNHAAANLFRLHEIGPGLKLDSYCELIDNSEPLEGKRFLEALTQSLECNLTRADGTRTRVHVRGGPIHYEGRGTFQLFLSELTHRAKLEQQLRQAEKLAALGQMISGVAHELNNPLAAIKGYVDLLLLTHDLDHKSRGALIKVSQETNRAAKLVHNFLAYARPEVPRLEGIALNDLIRSTIDSRRLEIEAAGADVRLSLTERNPAIQANADHLQQVVLNLLKNSLQAMNGQEEERLISITSLVHNHKVQIRFEDSGPGIADDVLPHIFEPFFTTKPLGAATGLGLSVSYGIILNHKGRIFCEPRQGRGACFIIELPEAVEAHSTETEKSPTFAIAKADVREKKRILVVDDEPAIAGLLKEMLEILGHSASVYGTPREALAALLEESFDLVISDFRMPGMTGGDLYKRAVETDPNLASRFIFLTGDMVNDETKEFFRANNVTCLLKPFQFSTIETAVAAAFSSRAETKALAA